jgi:hypothetical protein
MCPFWNIEIRFLVSSVHEHFVHTTYNACIRMLLLQNLALLICRHNTYISIIFCGLFYDAVSIQDCIAFSGRMMVNGELEFGSSHWETLRNILSEV